MGSVSWRCVAVISLRPHLRIVNHYQVVLQMAATLSPKDVLERSPTQLYWWQWKND